MNEPKPPLVLSAEERRSPLWKKLKDHWQERLEVLRKQNDGDRPETETAKLRGQIAECKALLWLERETDIELPPR